MKKKQRLNLVTGALGFSGAWVVHMVDNSIISYFDYLTYIALLTGRSMRQVPLVKLRWLRPVMVGAATAWTWLEKNLGVPRVRVFEVQSATYVSSSYWLSNRKSQQTGFQYAYPDVRGSRTPWPGSGRWGGSRRP